MKKLALLVLLALCACEGHRSHRQYHDNYNGRGKQQVNDSHHGEQSHDDSDDNWWNSRKRPGN